ncbi:DUF4142 domain-containing protein [Pseudonocardia sp. NPDC046786]|uniref:DUF4142 domain-containing protein n=1 Tax=Pseudonocardia sp. NPDC046786 TaxID=3155471 RepID=UPI003401D0B4
MSRRIPGPLRWSILVALAGVVVVAVAQSWVAAAPFAAVQGWTQTQWGPLGPADRDLLEKVRLAGLWEAPTGQQGEQQASSPAVREVARKLGVEHHDLDAEVRTVAEQLGVQLPSRPNDQQIAWMNDLTARTGTDYDRQFVQILRAAHGSVLPAITEVRVGTRNELMRQFAIEADTYVTRHLGYLESTGLVDYDALPAPPLPDSVRTPSDLVVPGLVVGVALLAAGGLLMTLYRRGRPAGASALAEVSRLLPAGGAIPRPRRARDDGAAPARAALAVGPPDPWDELARAPQVRPRTGGAHAAPGEDTVADLLAPDGYRPGRSAGDRHEPDGFAPEPYPPAGLGPDDVARDGRSPDGHPPDGHPPDGHPPDGYPVDGFAPDPYAPDGLDPDPPGPLDPDPAGHDPLGGVSGAHPLEPDQDAHPSGEREHAYRRRGSRSAGSHRDRTAPRSRHR